jgi:hypothetical protein
MSSSVVANNGAMEWSLTNGATLQEFRLEYLLGETVKACTREAVATKSSSNNDDKRAFIMAAPNVRGESVSIASPSSKIQDIDGRQTDVKSWPVL